MSEIDLTDEDLSIIYGKSALAAFMGSMARAVLKVEGRPGGAIQRDSVLKELQENLRRISSPNARDPMAVDERRLLRQYYRVFLAFYRDPNALENLLTGKSSRH